MKKRILIFSLAYYPMVGGAEVAIKELTDRLTDYDFDMVTLRFDKAHVAHEKIGNVDVYRVGGGMGYLSKILFVPEAAVFAWDMQRKGKYDGFWAMMSYMSFPIVLARMLGVKVPYVLTLQDGDPFEHVFTRLRILVVKPLLMWGFKGAKMVQAISNFLAGWAIKAGVKKDNIEVIPNGVDIKRFFEYISDEEIEGMRRSLGKSEGDIYLTSSSRLVEKNGLDDVVRALKYLPENVSFINFGVGPDKEKLLALAKDIGVGDRLRLLDHPGIGLPKCFRACDIFIRPSLSEGQGISFLEGMASGLPVIATRVGGIPDFLFDPDTSPDTSPTGLFVNVRDPEDIARQVKRLIDDEALRLTLVENGKTLVKEKYDWELIAEEMKSRVFDTL